MRQKHNVILAFLTTGLLSSIVLLSSFSISGSGSELPGEENFTYRKVNNNAFTFNEKLEYRVHYGLINAANIVMEVGPTLVEKNDRLCFNIKAEGKTLSSFDWAYKVRDRFETFLDQEAMAPINYNKSVQEDKYLDNDFVTFKHSRKKLYGVKGILEMPEYTHDIISALYYVRNIDFSKAKSGDKYPLNVYLDNKIYNLGFKYDGKETLNTDIGKVKCIRFVPTLVVDRVFKDQDDMTVWVSDDENKIPIRVKAKIMVGSIKVDITKYSNLKNDFKALVKK